MDEPFCLSKAQIADLTDYEIYYQYFHARDDDGRLIRPGSQEAFEADMEVQPATDTKTTFFQTWQSRGEPQARIEKRWLTWLKDNPAYPGPR